MRHRRVLEIMSRECRSLSPAATVRDAIAAMGEARIGCVTVVEHSRIVGLFTERDLLRRVLGAGRDPDDTRLHEVMSHDPDTISPSESVDDLIRRIDEFGERHLPVVERGHVVGVVSLADCSPEDLAAMAHELEDRRAIAERAW